MIVREPRERDIRHVAAGMREMDRRECAAFGHAPERALRLGVVGSLFACAVVLDGRPAALFGVAPVDMLSGEGRPWLLGTDAAVQAGRAWLLAAPFWVDAMQAEFPLLTNSVHRDNRASIRWLRRLGFTVDGEASHVGGEPMLRFWRRRGVRPDGRGSDDCAHHRGNGD